MAIAERMLNNVASWLDRQGVEYERQHFGEDHFDPCLSLPVGYREAVEIDATPPASATERGFYTVSYRSWDATGGLASEQEVIRCSASAQAAQHAAEAARLALEEQQETEEPPEEPEQPVQSEDGFGKSVAYEVWRAEPDGTPTQQWRPDIGGYSQSFAEQLVARSNAEEAEVAHMERREIKQRFVVVKATTIRRVTEDR